MCVRNTYKMTSWRLWIWLQSFRRQFCGMMKPNWNCLYVWTSSMSGMQKNRPEEYHHYSLSWRWVIDNVGLFFVAGTGNNDRIPCFRDSQKFQDILKRNVMSPVDKFNLGDGQNIQQDNDLKHTSKATKTSLWKDPGTFGRGFSITRFKSNWKHFVAFAVWKPSNTTGGFCTCRMGKGSNWEV